MSLQIKSKQKVPFFSLTLFQAHLCISYGDFFVEQIKLDILKLEIKDNFLIKFKDNILLYSKKLNLSLYLKILILLSTLMKFKGLKST